MTAFQLGRGAVGTSLLATGLTWTCWQITDEGHGCPPLVAWVAIALIGFVLIPKRWGRKASGATPPTTP